MIVPKVGDTVEFRDGGDVWRPTYARGVVQAVTPKGMLRVKSGGKTITKHPRLFRVMSAHEVAVAKWKAKRPASTMVYARTDFGGNHAGWRIDCVLGMQDLPKLRAEIDAFESWLAAKPQEESR